MIVTVANHKGGVGKTTTVLTLAHVLALAGRAPVAVVDLDAPAGGKGAGASQALRRARALRIPAYTADTVPATLARGRAVVLIDTPPDVADEAVVAALGLADVLLVPTGAALDEVEVTAAFVADAARHLRVGARVLVVLTRVPFYAGRQADAAAADLRDALAALPVAVAGARIPALAAYPEAAAAGTTVATGRTVAWRRAARPYEALAAEIEEGNA